MKSEEIRRLCIDASTDLKTTLLKMNEGAKKILLVIEEHQRLFGVLTDGDIRRWIVSTGTLEGEAKNFCNKTPIIAHPNSSQDTIKKLLLQERLEAIPIVNEGGEILDIVFWEDLFQEKAPKRARLFSDVAVVIMAGGKGTRLEPFTRILPKPLIPIGEKPVIEIIIDKFREYAVQHFYLSIHHKSKMIKAYFEELQPDYTVHYLEEEQPLGTAGSLKLLADQYAGSFFVSNCDILIESDYGSLLDEHYTRDYDITVVASVKNYRIPYGICEIKNGGQLKCIQEKPEYAFLVNTGLYLMKSDIISLIPEKTYFDMTDLIAAAQDHNGKIGVFPVNENAWIDIGEWEEYKQAIQKFSF